jgi:hypothetical protein
MGALYWAVMRMSVTMHCGEMCAMYCPAICVLCSTWGHMRTVLPADLHVCAALYSLVTCVWCIACSHVSTVTTPIPVRNVVLYCLEQMCALYCQWCLPGSVLPSRMTSCPQASCHW